MTDYGRERQSYVSRAGGDEGGLGRDGRTLINICKEGRRVGRPEEEDNIQRRVEKTIRSLKR